MVDAAFDREDWQRRLAYAVAASDLIVSGDRLLGRVSPQHDQARLDVVALLDEADAAGMPVDEQDAALRAARQD